MRRVHRHRQRRRPRRTRHAGLAHHDHRRRGLAAGEVNFDRTWDCNDDGTPDITLDDVDLLLTDAREVRATDRQLRRINEQPCDPWIGPDPAAYVAGIGDLPFLQNRYDAAFSMDRPPGAREHGLDSYTDWLNTPLDGSCTAVYNHTNWNDVFRRKRYPRYLPDFREQFIAAVPPASWRDAPPSPFDGFHFNLTGIGDPAAAMRNGSAGAGAGNYTNWELYNAMASARDKTNCHQWATRRLGLPQLG